MPLDSFIFFPHPAVPDRRPGVEERAITADDGVRLHAWYAPAAPSARSEARPTGPGDASVLVSSHGNGEVTVPVSILVGSRDRVEHESALRKIFGRLLPQATVRVLEGIGHLSPLEAPDAGRCLR